MEEIQGDSASASDNLSPYTSYTSLDLSPIVEKDESTLNDSNFDTTLYVTTTANETIQTPSAGNSCESFTVEKPSTPPETLRKRISELTDNLQSLSKEHTELVEFTQLEKQINHEHCESKTQVAGLQAELESLTSKIEDLKHENTSLRFSLSQTKSDAMLQESNFKQLMENSHYTLTVMSSKMFSSIKDDYNEGRIQQHPFLESLSKKDGKLDVCSTMEDKLSFENYLSDLQHLTDLLVLSLNETKSSVDMLNSQNLKLLEENKSLIFAHETIQNKVLCLDSEKRELHEKIDVLTKENMTLICVNMVEQCLATNSKLEKLDSERRQAEELNNINKTEYLAEMLHDLCNSLDNVHRPSDLISIINDPRLVEFGNLYLDDLSQTCFNKLLDKAKITVSCLEEDYTASLSNFEILQTKVNKFEESTGELANAVSEMSLQVKDKLLTKVSELESKKLSEDLEYSEIQRKVVSLEDNVAVLSLSNKNLKNKLDNLDDQLKQTNFQKSEVEKEIMEFKRRANLDENENIRKSLIDVHKNLVNSPDSLIELNRFLSTSEGINVTKACVNPFLDPDIIHTFSLFLQKLVENSIVISEEKKSLELQIENLQEEINLKNGKLAQELETENYNLKELMTKKKGSCEYCLEELQEIREMMAREVENLDQEDKKSNILKDSSTEIFFKLMDNIMKKEQEIMSSTEARYQEDIQKYQEDLQKAKESDENGKSKRKSLESWMNELQNDNESMSKQLTKLREINIEFESKIKELTSELKATSSRFCALKEKETELKVENDTLLSQVLSLKKSLDIEKERAMDLKEMLEEKTKDLDRFNIMLSLKNERTEDNLRENSQGTEHFKERKEYANKTFEEGTTNNPTSWSFGLSPGKETCKSKCKGSVISQIEKEREFLEVVINETDDKSLGEQLLSYIEQLTISKDIVRILCERFARIEKRYSSNLSEFENHLSNFKANILKLFESISSENFTFIDEIPNSSFVETSDLTEIANNLKQMKDEYSEMENSSEISERNIEEEGSVLQKLSDEFQKVKSDLMNHKIVSTNLQKTLEEEQTNTIWQEKEIKLMTTKLDDCMLENSTLQEQVKNLQDQIRRATLQLLNSKLDFSSTSEDLADKIAFLIQSCEDKAANLRNIIKENEEDCHFFCFHFNNVLSYMNEVEIKSNVAKHIAKTQSTEINRLKRALTMKSKDANEQQSLLYKITSLLPSKVSTSENLVETLKDIIVRNSKSQEIGEKLNENIQSLNKQLSSLRQELKSSNKHISNLNLQISEYEDVICDLRSKLRNLNLQHQRDKAEKIKCMSKHKTADRVVQTDTLCCTNLKLENERLNESLGRQGSLISNLKLQVENASGPYKAKINDLELSLKQAKERIGSLRRQLTEQLNCVRDIAESYQTQKHIQIANDANQIHFQSPKFEDDRV